MIIFYSGKLREKKDENQPQKLQKTVKFEFFYNFNRLRIIMQMPKK